MFKSTPLFFGNIADDKLIDKMYESPFEIVDADEIAKMPKKPLDVELTTTIMSDYIEVEIDDGIFVRTVNHPLIRSVITQMEWYDVELPPGVDASHDYEKPIYAKVKRNGVIKFQKYTLVNPKVRKIHVVIEYESDEEVHKSSKRLCPRGCIVQ